MLIPCGAKWFFFNEMKDDKFSLAPRVSIDLVPYSTYHACSSELGRFARCRRARYGLMHIINEANMCLHRSMDGRL